jgi:hypothetical protein
LVKLAVLILSVALRVLPVCRTVLISDFAAAPPIAAVARLLAVAAVLLGSYHAVSGASAGISGLVKYSGSTPIGSPTNNVIEPVAQPFRYRITVSNPGTDFAKNYYDCYPLPPGLTINTNVGAAGYITGTPTNVGTYGVTLVAGNLNYPTPATAQATIYIYPTNMAPVITRQPQNQSVVAGRNAAFSVVADGTPSLSYQWTRVNLALAGATSSLLSLTNVNSSQAGNYRVIITNSFGSVTSAVARLAVQEPLIVQLRLGAPGISNGLFHFEVTGPIYTNYVIWGSSNLVNWTPLATNSVTDGYLQFTDTNSRNLPRGFYRASLSR